MLEKLQPLTTALDNLFKPLKNSFDKIDWEGITQSFAEWNDNLNVEMVDMLASAVDTLRVSFETLEEPLTNLYNDALKPIIEDFGGWILSIVEQTKQGFEYLSTKITEYKDEIEMVIVGISAIIQVIWATIKPIIDAAIEGIFTKLQTTMDFIFSLIQIIGNFFGFFKNVFSGIKSLIQGDTDEAVKYFKQALGNIINAFVGTGNAIISVINNLWSLIFDAFKGFVNSVGGLISKIGEWLGFDWNLHWNAQVPLIPMIPEYIPKLATGAVLPPNKPFLAQLGDQKHGRNLEAPENLIRQIVREETGNKNFVIKAEGSMSALIRMLNLRVQDEQERSSVFG
jgi:hypothetical protein